MSTTEKDAALGPRDGAEAPAEAGEILDALGAAAPVGLALFDGGDLTVRWTNRAYLALLDQPWRERGVVGLRLEAFAPSAKVVPALMARVSATGQGERLEEQEFRGLRRGVTYWQVALHPVERRGGRARDVLLAVGEVTALVEARRRAELAANQARDAEQAAQRGVDRLSRLLETTAALAAARTREEAAGALFDGVRRSVGTATGVLLVPGEPGMLRIAATHGLDPADVARLGSVPITAPLPVAAAAARLEPIWLEERAEAEAAFPGLRGLPSLAARAASLAALPLKVGAELRGVLGLGFADRRSFEPGERAFLMAMAEQGALALERSALLAALRREQGRLALSQELTSALSSARTVVEVATAVFERGLVAFGARACMLALHQGGELRVEHLHGYRTAQAEDFRAIDPTAPVPVAEAFREGRPVWVESRADMLRRYPALAGRLDPGHGAWAALPLQGEGGPFGVLGLSFAEERTFDPAERALAVSLSRKCAQALERARLYESERAARAEAERASALQERMAAIVGHDLRTPLAAILLSAQSLQRRGSLGERERAAAARIAASAVRMSGIIRDLLDFARARQGQGIPVRRAPLRADELCLRAVGELREAHPSVPVEVACPEPLVVEGDADRLHQALTNLLANAVQHGSGQPIAVAAGRVADEVVISVHNGGAPIDPALLPRIFEPFQRGGEPGEGVGLGLYIVGEIVKAHRGRVEAASSAEAGTTFTVRLAAGRQV